MVDEGVVDDIDLRLITEEELTKIEELAKKAEEAAKKAEEHKQKLKKTVKEISEESKKLIGGPPQDISKFSGKKTLPIEAALGESPTGHNLRDSPLFGLHTTGLPMGLGERITAAERKAERAEKEAEEALNKIKEREGKLRDIEDKYTQTLSGLKNPFGFFGGGIRGLIGKGGIAGMIILFGEEVVTDMFDLVRSWFDTPGGIADIRKRIHDAINNIGDLGYQIKIADGETFFTDDTRLYQHSPFHSNTEKLSSLQMLHVYSSKYD